MIFVTVGTQLPFDRLLRMMDEIAPALDEPIIAQSGASSYTPGHFETSPAIAEARYNELFSTARVVVSHAGIGTVLRAARERRPLVLVARRARWGEQRDDHQVATCEHLRDTHGIYVADDVTDIRRLLSSQLNPVDLSANSHRRELLVRNLASYLNGSPS